MEFNKARTRQAIQGREVKTNIVDNLNDHTLSINVQKMFKTFVRPNTPAKTQINKAARIPKNELIDLLHQCFDEYAFWPMKALKARTRQPEAYLKETLADIAALVKGGPFASTWKRTDVYNRNLANQIIAAAPGGEDLDDDADEEMEDVV
jgi:transcription initiation factor TFIIF subunit beta